MSHCTATTTAGRPCKNHAVKGSQLCKADTPTSPSAPSVESAQSVVQLTGDYSIEDANAGLFG